MVFKRKLARILLSFAMIWISMVSAVAIWASCARVTLDISTLYADAVSTTTDGEATNTNARDDEIYTATATNAEKNTVKGFDDSANNHIEENEMDSDDAEEPEGTTTIVEEAENNTENEPSTDLEEEKEAGESNSESEEMTTEKSTENAAEKMTEAETTTEAVTKIQETMPVYTYTAMDTTMYAKSAVNVRTLPSTSGDKIGALKAGDRVSVTGQCKETGWYRIKYNDSIGYVSNNYLTSTKPEETTTAESTTTAAASSRDTTYDIIEAKGNISQSFLDEANEILSVVPAALRKQFVEDGWKYYVSSKSVAKTYSPSFSSLKGLTIYDDRLIYLDYRDAALTAVIHEFGHYFDWSLGYISWQSEFTALYNSECATFKSKFSYNRSGCDNDEYFAEAFKMYYLNDSKLKSTCPGTYAFLDALLSGY